jgi:probable HAF family extracellular repeat protein
VRFSKAFRLTTSRHLVIAALGLAALYPAAIAQIATFQGIGDLPGGSFQSYATRVSADGSTVLGESISGLGTQAVRWRGGVLTALMGPAPSSTYASTPDGNICVGFANQGSGIPTKWDASGTPQILGRLPCGTNGSAIAISADGSVVVGYTNSCNAPAYNAFRWTQASGMTSLGDLLGGPFASVARDVSADGKVVIGVGATAGGNQAWRWTADTGMLPLPFLPGGLSDSDASGVSRDGTVIVGSSAVPQGREAFRWTAETGAIGLGDLAGGSFSSVANSASDDGRVIVGQGSGPNGMRAMVWDVQRGMRELAAAMFVDFGLTLPSGWILTTASGISADGSTIVGSGTNPFGKTEGWIAYVGCWVAPAIGCVSGTAAVCSHGSTSFSTTALGAGPFSYHWRKNSNPISVTANPSASTATLLLANISDVDTGLYDCVVTNACGSTATNSIELTICYADITCDGQVDDSDFVPFAAAYNILDCADPTMPLDCPSDLNRDAIVDDSDFVVFAAAYNQLSCN